jgi:DNA-binding NtrC family response regulator
MGTSQYRVLMSLSDNKLGEAIQERLNAGEFDLLKVNPSSELLPVVCNETPDILVFELDPYERFIEWLIFVLKKLRPNLKIIAFSESSSRMDARVIEQGIFYYMTKPTSEEIVQVVQAAAKAVEMARMKEQRY